MAPYTPGGTKAPARAPLTIPALAAMARDGTKIAMLTAYDASFAALADAKALVAAGASLLVVECVPQALGEALTRAVPVPVIGIGAGPHCSGQVLVLYDALGITPGRVARFVRNFLLGRDSVEAALAGYAAAVKDGSFPGPEHCF